MKKKILVVTERRADYSKFRPILKEISESTKLDYCLVVTGSHLLSSHGKTIKEIKSRGIPVLVGIGGINIDNAASIYDAGADSICVASAVTLADDPETVTKKLVDIYQSK